MDMQAEYAEGAYIRYPILGTDNVILKKKTRQDNVITG